jgi:oxygen-independent coproporphyrinogen-3 oxidase
VLHRGAYGSDRQVIGVYIHVPFCRTLCPYCDFYRVRVDGPVPDLFVDALLHEIETFEADRQADAVFVGGGTPSLLAPVQLERILDALRTRFVLWESEITLEANPDDVTEALADAWRALGVNRVSLGVQSFDDAALRYLGRRHDAAEARRACEIVAGRFANWSMDFIYGAHPTSSWASTLAECASFASPHVSCYGLTFEPGTPFGKRAHEALGEDEELACYRQCSEQLIGYQHYEVSNFARPGFQCRHNLYYWHNGEYAGFGPGSFSFIDGVRSCNESDLSTYILQPGRKAERLFLSKREIQVETLIQHFRLREGLSRDAYAQRFGRDLDTDFGTELQILIQRGLLEERGNRYLPTKSGFELNNEIGLVLVDSPGDWPEPAAN